MVITTTQKFESLDSNEQETLTDSHSPSAQPATSGDTGAQKKEPGDKTRRMTKRHNVVDKSGKLDVGATIRSRSKTVSAAQLAERHDRVRVLNMSTIKALIQDAVAESVERLGAALDENEKKKLLSEAEDEFKAKLKEFQAEKKGAEEHAKQLQDQLSKVAPKNY